MYIKNKVQDIKNSWSWRNRMTILCLSLLVALMFEVWGVSLPQNSTVYAKETEPTCTVEMIVEERKREFFEKNKALYMEMANTDAMESVGREAVTMMYRDIVTPDGTVYEVE